MNPAIVRAYRLTKGGQAGKSSREGHTALRSTKWGRLITGRMVQQLRLRSQTDQSSASDTRSTPETMLLGNGLADYDGERDAG